MNKARPDKQCAGCKIYFLRDGKIVDWWDYMVEDAVWKEARFLKTEVACLPCLENRLGRQLVLEDFTNARCNNTIRYLLGRDKPKDKQKKGLNRNMDDFLQDPFEDS